MLERARPRPDARHGVRQPRPRLCRRQGALRARHPDLRDVHQRPGAARRAAARDLLSGARPVPRGARERRSTRSPARTGSDSPGPAGPCAPIEAACYWLATRPAREPSVLAGDVRADVAIVGGGFTGLWTALFLKELDPAPARRRRRAGPRRIRRQRAGTRASSARRSTTHTSWPRAISAKTRRASWPASGGRTSTSSSRFLAERGIDAEFERSGQLQRRADAGARRGPAGRGPASRAGSGSRTGDSSRSRGVQDEIREPALPRRGVSAPTAGRSIRSSWSEGLRGRGRPARRPDLRAQRGRGARAPGRPRRRRGRPAARVRADEVVLATNAYTPRARGRRSRRRFLPLYDYILVSEP